jgi:hypothetical protein
MKRKLSLFIVFALVFCLFAPKVCAAAQQAAGGDKVVEVEGYAAIRDGNKSAARQAAEREAYRSALEQGIGAYVEGVTEVKNFEVVKDKIFSRTEGIVKDLKVNREWVDEDDVLHITATCRVAVAALDGVLGPAVIDMLGNPRVLILIDERIDNIPVFLSTTEGEVLKVFEKAGYQLINAQQDQSLKGIDIDAARHSQDPALLREIARTCRAEILVSGKAYSSGFTRQRIEGISITGGRSTVQLQTALTDSAYMVGSDTIEAKTRGMNQEDVAIKGFQQAAPAAARSVVHKIAYQMVGGTSLGGRTVNVKIAEIPFRNARNLESALKDIDGVKEIYRRGYGKTNLGDNTLELDIVSDKTADEIADFLLDMDVDIERLGGASSIEGRSVGK